MSLSRIEIAKIISILITPVMIVLSVLQSLYNKFLRSENVKSIAGEIAVVTGGGGGLGRAISMELAKHGCHVAVVDINYEEAQKTVQLINENYKVNTKAYKIDITSYDEVVRLNKIITDDLGKATILVNNAGIIAFSDIFKPDPIEIQRMINVNLTSHIWTKRVFLENMKEVGKGHIVAICSTGGLGPFPLSSVYCSTKYGVRGFMRTLRVELRMDEKCRDIKTTTVFPTVMDTNSGVLDDLNKCNWNTVFQIQSGVSVAYRIIQGMLRNEVNIGVPALEIPYMKCIEFWPAEIIDRMMAHTFLSALKKSLGKQFK
ncbi:17-beta-hydroxysteroid dehydrogenase 13-like [Teleopsis dalmanni]|uniref:17-beta-hydroxysteroid dehydrogenase 13-like n=1 Tax=Teleopsis dalmanni TaxID=139649 RepID=UPI0018CE791B|nr:17-beta-hydroxysteroid dehydrogenase 13-like [Teleopsis dalmanni]